CRAVAADAAAGLTSPAMHESLDREAESRAWLERLRGQGADRDRALAELHALLLRAARYTLGTRRTQLNGLGPDRLEELATEAADDALLSILGRLDDFRGDSRFTTWAWKFAFYEACIAVRRQRWLGREVPVEDEGWEALEHRVAPVRRLEQAETL